MKLAFGIVAIMMGLVSHSNGAELAPMPRTSTKIELNRATTGSVPIKVKAKAPPTDNLKAINTTPKVGEGGFEGPTKAKVTQTIILDYLGEIGVDPQFTAVPKPEMFRVLKDFSGKPAILITPGEALAGKTILIVYADNKANKTIVSTHAVEVAPLVPPGPVPPPGPGPGPTPPVPGPDDATKLKYFGDLKAAYLVSPNSDALTKLLEVYIEMGNTTFTKRSEASLVLKSITAKKLSATDLRKVRDTVQLLLDRDVGNDDSVTFDNSKLQAFFKDVATALTAIKAGK